MTPCWGDVVRLALLAVGVNSPTALADERYATPLLRIKRRYAIFAGMTANILQPLIESAGSQAAFARRIGAAPAFVWQWLSGVRPISPRYARAIEAEFGVSRYVLRPNIFGQGPGAP